MGLSGRERILPIAVLLGAAVLAGVFWWWIDTIPLGVAAAVVLVPLRDRLSARLPPPLSALSITAAVLAAAVAGICFTLAVMQGNLATNREILAAAEGGIGILADQYTRFGIPREAVAGAMAGVQGLVDAIGTFWSGLTPAAVLLSPGFILFSAALFLSLWQGDRVLRWTLVRMPREWLGTWRRLATVAVDTIYAVLVVHLVMVALTFALSLPFYRLLGYGHVLYLSTVTALCELVPVLGASIPMVILLLFSFAIGDLRGFLLVFFVGYLLVALLPELTLRPILMGRRTHLSPVIMFFGFMGGILLLGTSGFLLGPLILAVVVSWWRIRREQVAKEPGETARAE